MLCPSVLQQDIFILCLVLVQPRKTGNRLEMNEKLLAGTLSINTNNQSRNVPTSLKNCLLECKASTQTKLRFE